MDDVDNAVMMSSPRREPSPGLRSGAATTGRLAHNPADLATAKAQEIKRLEALIVALEPAGEVMADDIADLKERIKVVRAEEQAALELAKAQPARARSRGGSRMRSGNASPRGIRSGAASPPGFRQAAAESKLRELREQNKAALAKLHETANAQAERELQCDQKMYATMQLEQELEAFHLKQQAADESFQIVRHREAQLNAERDQLQGQIRAAKEACRVHELMLAGGAPSPTIAAGPPVVGPSAPQQDQFVESLRPAEDRITRLRRELQQLHNSETEPEASAQQHAPSMNTSPSARSPLDTRAYFGFEDMRLAEPEPKANPLYVLHQTHSSESRFGVDSFEPTPPAPEPEPEVVRQPMREKYGLAQRKPELTQKQPIVFNVDRVQDEYNGSPDLSGLGSSSSRRYVHAASLSSLPSGQRRAQDRIVQLAAPMALMAPASPEPERSSDTQHFVGHNLPRAQRIAALKQGLVDIDPTRSIDSLKMRVLRGPYY